MFFTVIISQPSIVFSAFKLVFKRLFVVGV